MPEARKRKQSGHRKRGATHTGTDQGSGWIRKRTMKKIRRWGFVAAATIIGVLVILSFAFQSFPGAGPSISRVEEKGDPILDTGRASHQPEGRPITYETIPPNSGDHWPRPASCGTYDEEINDELVIHNMEHGHVVISYNLTNTTAIQNVKALVDTLPGFTTWGILRPYSRIPEGKVALTVWDKTELIEGEHLDIIEVFYNRYKANRFSEETAQVGAIPCDSSVHM